jgi:hypothetical protein
VSAYLPTVKTLVKLKKLPSPDLSENKIKINKNKKKKTFTGQIG